VVSIFFLSPLLITALSAVFLNEKLVRIVLRRYYSR
jgi:drug/metabolite transporter (DMT)-like permease